MAGEHGAERPRNWAFALVHGIGAAEPLEMIQLVTKALQGARPSLRLDKAAEVHTVREKHAHGPGADVRHTVIRHGHIPGAQVRFGTAHWADITYYRQGLVSLIGTLLMAAFGVRFFAQVAARHGRDAPRVVRRMAQLLGVLLNLMVIVLALFVFPVTFVSLIYSVFGLIAEYAVKDISMFGLQVAAVQRLAIAVFAGVVCIGLAFVGRGRVYPMRGERTLGLRIFNAIAIYAAVLSLALVLDDVWLLANPDIKAKCLAGAPAEQCSLIGHVVGSQLMYFLQLLDHDHLMHRVRLLDKTGLFFAVLHTLQIALGVVMLTILSIVMVIFALYVILAKITGRRFHMMAFAVASVVTIWIVNIVLLWPENLATHAVMTRYVSPTSDYCVELTVLERIDKNGSFLSLDTLSPSSYTVAKASVINPFAERQDSCTNRWGKRQISDIYPVIWFEAQFFVFVITVATAVLGLIGARWFWCSLPRRSLDAFSPMAPATRPRKLYRPRLIVAHLYIALVLAFAAVASISFVSRLSWIEQILPAAINFSDWPKEITVGAEWVRIGVIAFVTLFVLFSHFIGNGLKLLLDVVNHFTQPHRYYPVRRRIEQRFSDIVEHLLSPGDKPHLVIIAHSQGTMITFDKLREKEWLDKVLEQTASLTILTFGSPLTHVYQTYFTRDYPLLGTTRLTEVAADPRVRWVNAYRIDDYVGTYIENSIPNFPVNVPLKIGGHMNYWQPDVMCRVLSEPVLQDFILSALQPAQEPA